MAKYPFMTYVNDFMERMKDVYAPITWETVMRRYRRMNKDVLRLHREGKVSTTSPKNMTSDDIHAYLVDRRKKNFSSKEYSHDQSAMRNLFKFVKSSVFEDCLINNPLLVAHKTHVRLPPLDDHIYEKILERSKRLKPHDFRRHRAYCLVLLCIKAGTRTKEIRLAEVKDLNLETWVFDIVHVKGERTYGVRREVAIHPEIRHIVESYLLLRENWLIANSITTGALFPSADSENGHLTENSLRRIKGIVEADIGVKFDFRTLRRTFGQQLVDKDLDIESVSVLMGHKTTKTTELNYARKRNDKANDKMKEVW